MVVDEEVTLDGSYRKQRRVRAPADEGETVAQTAIQRLLGARVGIPQVDNSRFVLEMESCYFTVLLLGDREMKFGIKSSQYVHIFTPISYGPCNITKCSRWLVK